MAELLTGSSRVGKEGFRQLLARKNSNPPLEVVDLYYELEASWGLRADLLVSQMFHETGYLTSWWSQPPRRNMAGIGVTGEVSTSDPQSNAWAFKQEAGKWFKGYSFGDWRAAVQAHFAHMSAYVYPDERNNARQLDPRYSAARGQFKAKGWTQCKEVTDLNGKWAVPGTTYGEMITSLLNSVAAMAVSSPAPQPSTPPAFQSAPPPAAPQNASPVATDDLSLMAEVETSAPPAPEPTLIDSAPPPAPPITMPSPSVVEVAPPVEPVVDAPPPAPIDPGQLTETSSASFSEPNAEVDVIMAGYSSQMTTYNGKGTVNSGAVPVYENPAPGSTILNTYEAGIVLQFIGFTEGGADLGSGPRWFYISFSQGGGWIYSAFVN